MKKACISFLGILIIVVLIVGFYGKGETAKTEYLRIHIRANSDSAADQSVKYEIKDKVVDYLTPRLKSVTTKEQAISLLEEEKINVNRLIDGVLVKNGFDYTSKIYIRNEKFPTRVYDDLVLEEGFYDAVIVELGKAEGDNWWCVVYPPLCFTGEKVVYKSIIAELFEKLFGNDE